MTSTGDKSQVLLKLLYYIRNWQRYCIQLESCEDRDVINFFPIQVQGSWLQTKISSLRHFVTHLAFTLYLWKECLGKSRKNRFLTRDRILHSIFSSLGPGLRWQPRVPCMPLAIVEQLHGAASQSPLQLWKWGQVGWGVRQTGRQSRPEEQETDKLRSSYFQARQLPLQQLLWGRWGHPTSLPPGLTERLPYTSDQFPVLLQQPKEP